jgi:hypothetical protein
VKSTPCWHHKRAHAVESGTTQKLITRFAFSGVRGRLTLLLMIAEFVLLTMAVDWRSYRYKRVVSNG